MEGGGDWRVQSPFDSTRDSSHFQQRKSHGTLITSKVINIDLKDKRSSLLPSSTSLLELKHLAIKCVTFLEFSIWGHIQVYILKANHFFLNFSLKHLDRLGSSKIEPKHTLALSIINFQESLVLLKWKELLIGWQPLSIRQWNAARNCKSNYILQKLYNH